MHEILFIKDFDELSHSLIDLHKTKVKLDFYKGNYLVKDLLSSPKSSILESQRIQYPVFLPKKTFLKH